MFCSACGVSITSGGRFCANCGAEAVSGSQPAVNAAPQTGGERARVEGDALVGRTLEGKYRLDARIGAGGMGIVYRATRLLIGDAVAIKILHSEFVQDDEAERFRREAQAAARLKHPNAVQIYDFGVSADGLVYLVMELVEGESLRSIIKTQGPLAPSVAAEVMRQACAALDEAHAAHIIHRDVKPDNIIVRTTPQGLRVKVLDFGVAKLRDLPVNNLTQTGSLVGTPYYMSPEQCLGEELDHRADIYSLGIVLYEMLCGVVPFNATILTAMIVQHVNQPPPSLREKNPSIPAALEAAALRALEKKREARPQTAGHLAEEITRALSGQFWTDETMRDVAAESAEKAREAALGISRDKADGLPVARDAARDTPAARPPVTTDLSPTVLLTTRPSLGGAQSAADHPSLFDNALAASNAGSKFSKLLIGAALAVVLLGGATGLTMWLRATSAPTEDKGVGTNRRQTETTPPAGMAYVPGGEFVMGRNDSQDEFERPAHRVRVESFFIDKYEVTCEEYARFLRATGHQPFPAGWANGAHPPGAARHPVTGVMWDDANAYARWAGKRLPTEEEWELAARGTDERHYPWGHEWQSGQANADREGRAHGGVADVGQYPGASPYGVFDLVGNAWEWTASSLAAYPGGRLPKVEAGDYKVIRGGYWGSPKDTATITYRGYVERTSKDIKDTGFRCAKDASAAPVTQ